MDTSRDSLSKATDRAIAARNREFLSDPAAIAEAQSDGERYRLIMEHEAGEHFSDLFVDCPLCAREAAELGIAHFGHPEPDGSAERYDSIEGARPPSAPCTAAVRTGAYGWAPCGLPEQTEWVHFNEDDSRAIDHEYASAWVWTPADTHNHRLPPPIPRGSGCPACDRWEFRSDVR